MSETLTFADLLETDQTQLLEGASVFAYATALREYRDLGDPDALTSAFEALERAEDVLPEDADLAEIRRVLEALL